MKTANNDIYSLLAAAPQSLSYHLRDKQFKTLVEERTRYFVGREFIFRVIDEKIKTPDFSSGYIIIEGEPGVGKTALIAKLVKERGYVHHFNLTFQGITSTSAFLKNICAQLIVLYNLNYSILPANIEYDGGFLSQLLLEIAEKSNEPVIILIDALDEAEAAPFSYKATNQLFLPSSLPGKVYFVITSREKAGQSLVADNIESIYIKDSDPQNLEDIRLYIEDFLQNHRVEMEQAILKWNTTHTDFVEIVTEKSQGNFMYLVYVLRDIYKGKLTINNIDQLKDLPLGLQSYYEKHWKQMRNADEPTFEKLYKPVLCTLAAAKEPISLIRISEYTNLSYPEVRGVVREWREFLNEELQEGKDSLFRIYHNSFRDFLHEEVEPAFYSNLIASKIEEKILGWK